MFLHLGPKLYSGDVSMRDDEVYGSNIWLVGPPEPIVDKISFEVTLESQMMANSIDS